MTKFKFDPTKNYAIVDNNGEFRSVNDDEDSCFGTFAEAYENALNRIENETTNRWSKASPFTIVEVKPVIEIGYPVDIKIKVKKLNNNLTDAQVSLIPTEAWSV